MRLYLAIGLPPFPRSARQLRMFYIIGLGLCDEKDITVRGLEVGRIAFTQPVLFTEFVGRRL